MEIEVRVPTVFAKSNAQYLYEQGYIPIPSYEYRCVYLKDHKVFQINYVCREFQNGVGTTVITLKEI